MFLSAVSRSAINFWWGHWSIARVAFDLKVGLLETAHRFGGHLAAASRRGIPTGLTDLRTRPMSFRTLKWIGLAIATLVVAAMAVFLYLFIKDDVERPDGVIADAQEIVGSEIRELKKSLREWTGNGPALQAGGAELSPIGETVVSTGLVDLRMTRYALLGVPHCPFSNPGTIEADGDGLLFAHCSGRFFRLKLDAEPAIADTGYSLPMHWQEMVAYAPKAAIQEDTSINVLDLLRLDNGTTAVSYTWWNPEGKCFAFTVALLDITATPPVLKPVFEAEPCIQPDLEQERMISGHQAGGRIIQLSEDVLLVSIGDFVFDSVNHAADLVQDPAADLGKIVAIDLATGKHRHVSMGHRNPQGLTLMKDGRIFETEHGPQGGDEVNLIRDGVNYGWPLATLGVQYGGENWPRDPVRGRHSRFQKPMFAFMPSIGISQLMEARDFATEWNGDLLVASLAGHTLHRLRLDGDTVLYDEPILLNQRLRDMVQMQDGRIAILTDDYEIITLAVDREHRLQSIIAEAPEAARQTITKCLECHVLSTGNTASGRIPLTGIIGRNVAGWPNVSYSPGLTSAGGVWTRESLDAFLADPEKMAPGTPMASKAIRNAELRRDVLDLLGRLTPSP